MNATDVTGPCAAVHYGLIGGRKMEFQHEGKPIRWNAELQMVHFGSVIGKPKPNRMMVFRRPLVSDTPTSKERLSV